jgi:transposase
MLSLPPSVRVFVATQPVDGRKGADSLIAIVRDLLGHDPLSGHLYVFFSRRCDRVRIVYWDRNGIAMWTKRLERGRFRPAFAADGALSASAVEFAELALVLEGIELAGARRRPRWQPATKMNGPGISELAALSARS